MKAAGGGLGAVVSRFIAKVRDISCLVISTRDGEMLWASDSKPETHEASSLASSFVPSVESSSRLFLGECQLIYIWSNARVHLLTMVEGIIIIIVAEENGNLALVEEHLQPIREMIRPLLVGLD